MTKTLKLRFMIMLVTHGEMSRTLLTRRALGQIRQLNMPIYKRMLTRLIREEFVQVRKAERTGKPGTKTAYLSATQKGKSWVIEGRDHRK